MGGEGHQLIVDLRHWPNIGVYKRVKTKAAPQTENTSGNIEMHPVGPNPRVHWQFRRVLARRVRPYIRRVTA